MIFDRSTFTLHGITLAYKLTNQKMDRECSGLCINLYFCDFKFDPVGVAWELARKLELEHMCTAADQSTPLQALESHR